MASSRHGTASQWSFWPRPATGRRLNGHFGLVPPRDGVFLLLRPFALGFCLQSLRDKRDKLEEEAYRRDKSRAYLVDDAAWDEKVQEMGFIGPEDAITLAGMYAERTAFNTKRWFVKKIYQALELVYNAASLVIDTLRTFILIVLSILGPIVFGIAVWDGLGGSLSAWFARYISVYLWLPVSSILTALLTKIQVLMISKDIAELQNPGYVPDSGDWYYIVFFLIGIVGFF